MSDLDKGLRVATFDIEATDLKAQDGYMLCACIKEVNKGNLNGRTHTFRIDDHGKTFDDRRLVADTIRCLNSFDLIVGWFSSQYDFPFVNTRALKHRIDTPVKNFRRDLCLSARGFGKLKNNRLYNWEKFLFGNTNKTFLPWQTWIDTIRGEKKALDKIVHHCQMDVLSTERIYKRVMPLLGKLRRN